MTTIDPDNVSRRKVYDSRVRDLICATGLPSSPDQILASVRCISSSDALPRFPSTRLCQLSPHATQAPIAHLVRQEAEIQQSVEAAGILWPRSFEYAYAIDWRMVHCPIYRTLLAGSLLGVPAYAATTSESQSDSAAISSADSGATPVSVPRLHWESPEGCPSEAEFRQRLTEYLGRDVPATTTLSSANAKVLRDNGAFRVSLHVEQRGQVRVRTLDTVSCTEALDATALIVALAIDPTVATRLPNATSASYRSESRAIGVVGFPSTDCQCPAQKAETDAPKACPPREVTAVRPPQPEPALVHRPKTQGMRLSLYLATELAYRQLPGVPFGEGLGAAMDWAHSRLSLTASTCRAALGEASKGGDFRLVQGRATACWMTGERFGLGSCVAMSVGAIRAIGIGVTVPERATELWVSNGFGAIARYLHGESAIAGLYASAELPWRHSSFELSGKSFYRIPTVGLLGGLLVGLRFN